MRIVLDARYLGPKTSGIGSYIRAVSARLVKLEPTLSLRLWLPREAQLDEEFARCITTRTLSPIPNRAA